MIRARIIVVLGLGLPVTGTVGCESKSAEQSSFAGAPKVSAEVVAAVAPEAGRSAGLTLVTDPSLVCMVNNQFMGAPQIPIEVDGRTYYGCCEMCKGRLATDPSSRMASDPVSHKSIDKATATMGKTGQGRILYFESPDTFAKYAGQMSR